MCVMDIKDKTNSTKSKRILKERAPKIGHNFMVTSLHAREEKKY